MKEKYEIWLIKRKENRALISEGEQYEGPISITPAVARVLDQPAVCAIVVPYNVDDIGIVEDTLTQEKWHFMNINDRILILKPELSRSERKEIIDFIQRDKSMKMEIREANKCIEKSLESKKLKKRKGGVIMVFGRSEKEKIKKEVEELKKIDGVEFVALIDEMGEALVTAGKPEKVTEDELIAQTAVILGTSKRGGEILQKGTVIEIDIMWEGGTSVLKTLNEGYTLHVITSKDALVWVRPSMKATANTIQKILGG